MKNYIIIGSGPAGTIAALTLRKYAKQDKIILISEENYPFYDREHIIDIIEGTKTIEEVFIKGKNLYKKNKIEHIVEKVLKVDARFKTVFISMNHMLNYDSLLIATGGKPIIPLDEKQIYPELDKELDMKVLKSLSITPLYTLDDIIYIKNKLKFVENIAIVGGGTIAFKLIRALDKFEKNIIIVEKAPHILYKKLDEKASQIVKMEYLKRANIDIFENNEIIQYNHVKGILTSVTLKSGVEIDCELVILAAGINPNIDFLDETQFSINKGIVVSNTLQTNVPNVYAVGDVAETPDPLYNGSPILHHSWEFAIAQSKVAAINMLGHKVNFNNTIYLNKMTIGNIGIISAGIIDPKEGEYQILERFRIINSLYRKFVWENERLIGIILIQQLDENFPIKQVKKWVRSVLITQNIDKTHKEKHLHRNFKFLDWEKNRKPSRVLNIF